MIRNTRKLVLTSIALAATFSLAAACGSKKSSGGGGDAIVVRGNASPADFACNHSFSDPSSTNTTVGARIHAVSQEITSTNDLPGTRLVNVTVATLATSGTAVVTTSGGIGTLSEKDNTRYAMQSHHDPVTSPSSEAWVDTYGFNFLAPAVGSTSGAMDQRLIPTNLFAAFIGLIGFQPADLNGTYQIAGAVGDCTDQGAQIANATVMVPGGHLCSESLALPCISYIQNGAPNVGAKHTDNDGAFVIAGLPAGTSTTVQIFGTLTAGGTAEQIGELTVNGKDGTIALGASNPLKN